MSGSSVSTEVVSRLGCLLGATALEHRRDGWWLQVPLGQVIAMAETMLQSGARLGTMTGSELQRGETVVIYHYVLGEAAINIRTESRDRSLPSITPITRAADWIEREIHDLFGVAFVGHPNLTRLIRPPQVPPGLFRAPEATQA